MRLLAINGVWCFQNPVWNTLIPALRSVLPITEVAVVEDTGAHPWQITRLRRFRDRIVEKYDDGEVTLIVGHSMGGVTGCAVAGSFRRTCVVGIVSIFAPHTTWGGAFPHLLDGAGKLPAPIVTFRGRYDELVWWGTKHPESARHTTLRANHFSDLVDFKHNAETIADITEKTLFPKIRMR